MHLVFVYQISLYVRLCERASTYLQSRKEALIARKSLARWSIINRDNHRAGSQGNIGSRLHTFKNELGSLFSYCIQCCLWMATDSHRALILTSFNTRSLFSPLLGSHFHQPRKKISSLGVLIYSNSSQFLRQILHCSTCQSPKACLFAVANQHRVFGVRLSTLQITRIRSTKVRSTLYSMMWLVKCLANLDSFENVRKGMI